MTLEEAKAKKLKFGDPESIEAANILNQVGEVLELLEKRGADVTSRPKAGSALANRLLLYPADVVAEAYARFGIK